MNAMRTLAGAGIACAVLALANPANAAFDYRTLAAGNGGSLASARLKSDVMTQMRATLFGLDRCRAVVVRKMAVTKFVDPKTSWTERWIVVDCGHVRPVTLVFTPTPDGGADFHVMMRR